MDETAPEKGVTVTVTPGGAVCDIAVDGRSIAHVLPREGIALFIGGHGVLPRLDITLVPAKVTVKGENRD